MNTELDKKMARFNQALNEYSRSGFRIILKTSCRDEDFGFVEERYHEPLEVEGDQRGLVLTDDFGLGTPSCDRCFAEILKSGDGIWRIDYSNSSNQSFWMKVGKDVRIIGAESAELDTDDERWSWTSRYNPMEFTMHSIMFRSAYKLRLTVEINGLRCETNMYVYLFKEPDKLISLDED